MLDSESQAADRRYRVLIVTSQDIRMIGLRSLLERDRLVRVVGEVSAHNVVTTIGMLRPDAVAISGDGDVEALFQVAQYVREYSTTMALLVFADAVDFALETALWRLQIARFVVWHDVNPVSLHWLLGGVFKGGWHVMSTEAVEEVVLPADRRRHARDEGLRITDVERIVLRGLAGGLTERQVAAEIRRTERTVRRILTGLEVKFAASCRAELAAKAARLGLAD